MGIISADRAKTSDAIVSYYSLESLEGFKQVAKYLHFMAEINGLPFALSKNAVK